MLYVSFTLNNLVVVYSAGATSGSFAGSGVVVAGAGGTGTALNQLVTPLGLAFDAAGNLYVADAGNNRVLELPFSTATTSFAASGVVVAGSGGRGSGANQLRSPGDVAFAADGSLLVADTVN